MDLVHRLSASLLVAGLVAACAAPESEETSRLGAAEEALTSPQCLFFEVDGATTICHATGSVGSPYVILKVNEDACVNAHADHPHDYIAVNDPTCSGGGCLPLGAPADATVPCCEGLAAQNGFCLPIMP